MLGDGPNEEYSTETTMITEITTMIADFSTTSEPVNSSTKDTTTMTPSIATITTTPKKQTEQPTTTTTVSTTKSTTISTTTSSTTPKILTPKPTFPVKQIKIIPTTLTTRTTPMPTKSTPLFRLETAKPIKRIIKKATNINQNNSISQANESYFIPLSILLVGCGMVICLVGYFVSKYSNKWNRYNSQSIEYKSNYYSKRMEEPLVDDDTFASNDYINGACHIEERPLDNLNNVAAAPRPTPQINFKPQKLAKIRRPRSILMKKHIDQYSDEQCLTEDGDEFIDFLPQTN